MVSEQARLTIDYGAPVEGARVICAHGGVVVFRCSEETYADAASRALRLYDELRPVHLGSDCHCSTAELWARYGERSEKENRRPD